jgi:hypothetical protein
MIKVVSFSPFHGKINVDYMLKKEENKKKKINLMCLLLLLKQVITYIGSRNEAYNSYDKKN